MSNYTKTTDFASKDGLASGTALKALKGTELGLEFDNIAVAVATKVDNASNASLLSLVLTGSTMPSNGIYLPSANTLGLSTASTQRLAINSTGNWVVAGATANTNTLIVGSINFGTAISAQNTSAGSSSNLVFGVTNLTDADFNVTLSQVGAASKFANVGSGTAIPINLQTGGVTRAILAASNSDAFKVVDDGGTLQTVGWRDAPQRILAVSDAPGFADRGKQLYYNTAGGSTLTIPANASVALPIGFTALIVNGPSSGNMSLPITTDSLFGPGGVTGTRTIAPSSMATLTKITATAWMIAGSGVS